jgi:hypothetical protein
LEASQLQIHKLTNNMKTRFVELSLVLVIVAGAVFELRSQPLAAQPNAVSDTDGNDGRYRLVVTPNGMECVIDTKSGRVWHSTLDAAKNMIVFVSFTYENIDGELSTIPNETATSVVSRSQPSSMSQPASSGASQTNTIGPNQNTITKISSLLQEIGYAKKEAQFWQNQLDLVNEGKPFYNFAGWDKDGNIVLGAEVQPSEQEKGLIKAAIKNCLAQQEQKQQELRQLSK